MPSFPIKSSVNDKGVIKIEEGISPPRGFINDLENGGVNPDILNSGSMISEPSKISPSGLIITLQTVIEPFCG